MPLYGAACLECQQATIAGIILNFSLFIFVEKNKLNSKKKKKKAAPLSGDAVGSALLVAALADGIIYFYFHIFKPF